MGYDPYDYYDLGEFDQKGGKPTWFGSKSELLDLIQTAHAHGMQVYADLVLNHNSDGDAQEQNPIDSKMRWTQFRPRSGKFDRDSTCFHPSRYEQWDNATFEDMTDLCHRNPRVYSELIEYARWLLEAIGFDGFRYDMVKGYGGWMVRSIQELRALRGEQVFNPYGVGECWERVRESRIGSTRPMLGLTIRLVHLTFRSVIISVIYVIVTDSACGSSNQNQEASCLIGPTK